MILIDFGTLTFAPDNIQKSIRKQWKSNQIVFPFFRKYSS